MCGVCKVAMDANGCRNCGADVCEFCGVYVDGRWEHVGDCPAEQSRDREGAAER